MKDEEKSRAQLIEELQNLRKECEAARQASAERSSGTDVFHKIVENAHEPIISINKNGVIVYTNRKAEEMFGYAAGEMIGKSSADLIPHELREAEEKAVSRYRLNMPGGFLTTLQEGLALCKNGTLLPVEASYFGYQVKGEFFMTAIIRDIRDHKRIQKALEEARDFSDSIIESSVDAIAITNASGNIIRINNAFLQLLGLKKKEQAIGQRMESFFPVNDGEYDTTTGERIKIGRDFFKAMRSAISGLQKGEKITRMESYHIRIDKKIVPVEYTISPLFDENGAIILAVSVIRNITERKQAEKELSNSRDFLACLFDTSMEGIVVSDALGFITMVNNKALELLAFTREELIGSHFADLGLTLTDEKERAKHIIDEFLVRRELTGIERTWKRRDGSLIDVEMNISQITDKAGNFIGAMASFRDTSLRKKADAALRISEERYRRIFENAFVAIQEEDISPLMSAINELKAAGVNMQTYLTEHPDFIDAAIGMATITDLNAASLKLYGAKDKEELLYSMDKILREESLPALREALIALAEGKSFFQTETIHYTLHGEQKHVLLQGNFLVKQRDLNRVLISIIDITHIKLVEKKLLEHQQLLRSLTNQLSNKEEDEKRKMGMYLHDRIGQSLSVLKMQLEMMASALTGSDDREKCKHILTTIDEIIRDTRVLSYELSPIILHELGLEAALGWIAEQTQKRYNLAVTFKSDNKAIQLHDEAKIILYRAVSELLNNAFKHAWAQHVAVSINHRNGQVQITVEDDGVGFDPSELEGIAATERGFGLFSIRERLHYLGGSIQIKSTRYKGTRVTLLAPLK